MPLTVSWLTRQERNMTSILRREKHGPANGSCHAFDEGENRIMRVGVLNLSRIDIQLDFRRHEKVAVGSYATNMYAKQMAAIKISQSLAHFRQNAGLAIE